MKKNESRQVSDYLPLTESSFYILLSLNAPLHGYGIMQEVDIISKGYVSLGPGTLYGALETMERESLIEMIRQDGRRKVYRLTSKGAEVVLAQIDRLSVMLENGKLKAATLNNLVLNTEKPHEKFDKET